MASSTSISLASAVCFLTSVVWSWVIPDPGRVVLIWHVMKVCKVCFCVAFVSKSTCITCYCSRASSCSLVCMLSHLVKCTEGYVVGYHLKLSCYTFEFSAKKYLSYRYTEYSQAITGFSSRQTYPAWLLWVAAVSTICCIATFQPPVADLLVHGSHGLTALKCFHICVVATVLECSVCKWMSENRISHRSHMGFTAHSRSVKSMNACEKFGSNPLGFGQERDTHTHCSV